MREGTIIFFENYTLLTILQADNSHHLLISFHLYSSHPPLSQIPLNNRIKTVILSIYIQHSRPDLSRCYFLIFR